LGINPERNIISMHGMLLDDQLDHYQKVDIDSPYDVLEF
jgi:hypothetical protein